MEYQEPNQTVTPGGRIRFYKGLGLTPNNENTFFFADKEEQDTFFTTNASNTITFSNGSTDNPTMVIKSPFVRTFAIPANSAELFEYDYIQVVADTNGSGAMAKPLYMFIIDIQFVNTKTAVITCTLDVIQTFMFDWELGTQSVAQMHSNTIYTRFAEELKTPESAQPSPREVCKTSRINASATGSLGYLVVATEAPYVAYFADERRYARFYGYSAGSGSDGLYKAPVTDVDASQFIYTYVEATAENTAIQNLMLFLAYYNRSDRMGAIKSVVACPSILKGKDARDSDVVWVDIYDRLNNTTEPPAFTDYEEYFPGCTPVVPEVILTTTSLSAPNDMLGYAPKDTKTWSLLELEITTPLGEGLRVRNDEILNNNFLIAIKAIGGADPAIVAYPTDGTLAVYPNAGYAGAKSYRIPVISLANFPTYAIYDADRQELFETQQTIQTLGSIASFVSKIALIGMGI